MLLLSPGRSADRNSRQRSGGTTVVASRFDSKTQGWRSSSRQFLRVIAMARYRWLASNDTDIREWLAHSMCRSLQFADGTWNVPATLQVKSVPLG